VLTALTGRVPRKTLLVALMLVFTVGNLVAYLAPGYNSLIVARILTGLAHGVFFSIGSIIATSVVPKEKAASAIAIMFTGLTVALVTGVPLGTFIGQHLGWRATFLAVSGLGVVALLGSLAFVPRNLVQSAPATFRQQLGVLAQPRLLMVYAMTALGYGGTFLSFTYLAPILQEVTGFSANAVSGVLLVYGISVAFGNVWGGRLADRLGPIPALKRIFALLALVLLVLTFTAYNTWLVLLTVLALGAVAFGNVPGLQVYVVKQAQRYAPQATDVASGLNIAAFNIGIALGASLGGLVVEHFGLMHTPWLGALVVVGAFALTALSGRLDRRDGIDDRADGVTVAAH
jgi:predicted MFS family arabinose efflux permease